MQLLLLLILVPIVYWIISLLFLVFPSLLRNPYRYAYQTFNKLMETDKVLCIGHRGGGWQGPENTMQTFTKNHNHSHMFQLDVCVTKDGKLVVHHDHHLSRLCGLQKDIQDLNFDQMPRFKPEIQAFGSQTLIIKTQNNKIPLLEQLFEQFPEQPMNIQIKTPSLQAIKQFDRLVRKYRRQHITIWGTTGKLSQQLHQQNPETIRFYTAGQVVQVFILFITGLLPFWCMRQGIIDIPLMSDGFYRLAMRFVGDSKCKSCLFLVVYGLLKFFNWTSMFWIPHLKKRGILTFYWIVNTQQDFNNAVSKGCSGIMTDITLQLSAYLKRNHIYYGSQ